MRWLSYFLTIVFLSVLFALLFWVFTPSRDKAIAVTSPLPDFLSRDTNKQVTLLDIWSPIIRVIQGSEHRVPEVSAKAALLYDLSTGSTIYEKNAKEKLPMASLTKIMTAIVALENKKNDDRYVVHASNLVGEDSMGLTDGEVLTHEELLYGLILNSGNDAAEVLADNYPQGRNAFVKAMNDKAKSLGLIDTNFSNPSGLQGDGRQYTTTYDLLVMTKYAIDNFPTFAEVASTFVKILPQTATHKEYFLQNETNLVSSYPGVKGIKTGYTPEAGLCLVTYLDYGGHRIIGILLHSENRRQEMKGLLDYSLRHFGTQPPKHD